jgi:hypothetical protein
MLKAKTLGKRALALIAATLMATTPLGGQGGGRPWTTPRTPWGDPDLQGVWTSDDMRGVPIERPDEFGNRLFLTDEEFAARIARDEQTLRQQLRGPYGYRNDLRTRTFRQTSLIVEPSDGKIPPTTAAAQARATSRDRGSFGQGPFDGPEDFTLFDRCITRGVVGSILPVIYGNGNQVVQTPGSVAILYEMVHDARIIPLTRQPHPGDKLRQYMGDARGHWDGDTLVVETTNFTGKTSISPNGNGLPHSRAAHLTERIRRLDVDLLEYRVTIDDPLTYAEPWTMALTLTSPRGYDILPYECHEGNHGLPNILSAERADDRALEADAKKGIVRSRRRLQNDTSGPAVEGAER